jgi:glycosyltransferase involved in cell wall biosynthesis
MPRVSVIVPTYRRARFLSQAIASVVTQSYTDFEVIIVDDASNDDTENVVSRFSDPRIRYIKHETNKGGAAARNTGIKNAIGDFIAFLDDDDEWLPEKLRRQVEVLCSSSRKCGCVYTGCVKVERESGRILQQKIPTQSGDISDSLLRKNCICSTSSVLLRRECLDKVGLFDEKLPSYQDYDMWIRISKHFDFENIPEPLFIYYLHEIKIWKNCDAISAGLGLMIKKYGVKPWSVWKHFGYYGYLEVGILYCQNGDPRKGRGAYLMAIKLCPYQLKAYVLFAVSVFGAGFLAKLTAIRKKRSIVFEAIEVRSWSAQRKRSEKRAQ